MSFDSENPYASPRVAKEFDPKSDFLEINPQVKRKITAIVTDASSFWLVIMLSVVCIGWGCPAFGTSIAGIFYFIRYRQWQSLAAAYPQLLIDAPASSLSGKFQAARGKLVFGMAFCVAIFFLNALAIGMILSTFPSD